MTTMDGRRAPGVSGSPMGMMGTSPGAFSYNSSTRLFSASLVGPGLAGRARPTTQEVIAEAFGRRLHGLELLSVKKLNALNASAAKLEAHVASRAAAISRTSVATTEAGSGLGPGTAGAGAAAKAAAAAAAVPTDNSGECSSGEAEPTTQQPLSSVISVAFPAAGVSGTTSLPASQQLHHNGGSKPTKSGCKAATDISERGGQVVRLLALQDKIMYGALGNMQQQTLLSSPSSQSQSQSQLQLTLLSPNTGTRFTALASGEPAGGGGSGAASYTDKHRRLDTLGIKHDSKVAAATIKLFHLSPRSQVELLSRPQSEEGAPPTPTNSQRNQCLPDLVSAEDSSEDMREDLNAASQRQLARSREFTTMARFIQSLQEGDEVSLARQARNFARLNSSAPSQSQSQTSLQNSPSRAATAPTTLPILSPPRSQVHTEPQSPTRPYSLAENSPKAHTTADTKTSSHNSHPHKHLTLEVPESPILGAGPGSTLGVGSMAQSHSPARSLTSSNSHVFSPRKGTAQFQQDIDLGSMATSQGRSKDLLDGLMKAVEMFVGVGGVGQAASSPSLGGRGKQSMKGAAAGTGRESPFGMSSAAAVAALDDFEEGKNMDAPISPYSGVYGSPEKLTDRVRKKGALAVLTNPTGFREPVAAGEVALYREVAQRCRTALTRASKHPRDAMMVSDLQHKVANLHYCRPYFVAPRETLPELMIPLRPVSACSVARQNTHFVESASRESVFLPRADENESEDIIDTNAIRERQVRKDWNRVVRKDAFRALVGVEDPGAASGTTGLGHALDACLAVILRHKDSLRAVFTYYSMQGSGISDYCFVLGQPEWRAFIADCGFGVPDGRSGTPSNLVAAAAVAAAAAAPTPGGNNRLSNVGRGGTGPQVQQSSATGATGAEGQRSSKVSGGAAATRSNAGGTTGGRGVPTLKGRQAAGTEGAAGGGIGAAMGPSGKTAGRNGGSQSQGLASTGNALLAGSSSTAAAAGPGGAAAGPGSAGATAPSQASNQLADAIFAAVNVEPEKRIVDGQVAISRSLLRFEWYESLLRLATIRHVKGGEKYASIAAALEHMWTREVLPALLSSAMHEPNIWRIVRLHGDPEVNELFITHMELISALYSLFSAASKNQLMHLSDWIGLLNTCTVIGDATGVTLHAAKLAYSRSLCVMVDDHSQWSRAVCLTKCDFMEALARLAEELAPPPLEEVAEAMREAGITGRRLRVALEQPWTYYYNELPVELLVARRLAAAEAAAARSTTTGDESTLPSLQNSVTRLDTLPASGSVPATASGRQTTFKTSQLDSSGLHGAATASGPGSPGPHAASSLLAPPPPSTWNSWPKLSVRLEALLELMFGRLRDHWECSDNQQLAARLQATAIGLQAAV